MTRSCGWCNYFSAWVEKRRIVLPRGFFVVLYFIRLPRQPSCGGRGPSLEIELDTSLEDSGLICGRGYLAKVPIREDCSSSGRSAGRSRSCSSWQVEIRMVENVEGFQAKGRVQTLVDREYTGDLRIELIVRDTAEGVSASIPVGHITRTRRRRKRRKS